MQFANFREYVKVNLYDTWYQCSDYLQWHSLVTLKPDPAYNNERLVRWGATPTGPDEDWLWLQKLDGGWEDLPTPPDL